MKISIAEYGAAPDSGVDCVTAVRAALADIAGLNRPVVLDFPKGRYDFHAENAAKVRYHVSNSTSEVENPDVTKTIGMLLRGLKGLTIEGNGSLFVFHGRQTMVVLDGCEDIDVRNVRLDAQHPTIAEMTIERTGEGFLDVHVHRSSSYEIRVGKLRWVGPSWAFGDGPTQVFDPVRDVTWRIGNITARAAAEELSPGRLRIHLDASADLTPGRVLQIRDGVRDQVGVFAVNSRNIAWSDVAVHFAHGLGIVSQFCENVSFDRLDFSPRPETGRTAAGFADFLQFSGCRGSVRVADSRFVGSHDDGINVHGTHLRITRRPAENQLVVRFMHPQTYGLQAFLPGDEIAQVSARSLLAYAENRVETVEALSDREFLLTLENTVADPEPGDVVENVTWTPEVEITGNHFARIPTRGILVSTRRPVLISDNTFERLPMSAILIADDAASWYESGPVRDVVIRGNRFLDCGDPSQAVIVLAPENTVIDAARPVHRNISIEENLFQMGDASVLYAKSTRGLRFARNTVRGSDAPETLFVLTACSAVTMAENYIEGARTSYRVLFDHTDSAQADIAADQSLVAEAGLGPQP